MFYNFNTFLRKCPVYDIKHKQSVNNKYFICDLGIATYLCERLQLDTTRYKGVIAETYVLKDLVENRRIHGVKTGFVGNTQIDFLFEHKDTNCTVGVEVKYNDNTAKSAHYMLHGDDLDYVLFYRQKAIKDYKFLTTIPIVNPWEYDFNNLYEKLKIIEQLNKAKI